MTEDKCMGFKGRVHSVGVAMPLHENFFLKCVARFYMMSGIGGIHELQRGNTVGHSYNTKFDFHSH